MTREEVEEFIEEHYPDSTFMLADGLDEAFIGVANHEEGYPIAVYSIEDCVKVFIKQGMKPDEAFEYYSFNVESAYVGEQTPLFINTPE
tara:strand:- start:1182 stop:1448 length:267 start_codon:yes stop_codon:yes gene_type:complete